MNTANTGANSIGGAVGFNPTFMVNKIISNTVLAQPLRETPFYAFAEKIPFPRNQGIGLDGDILVGGSLSPARGATGGAVALPAQVSVTFTRIRRLAPAIYPLDPSDTGSATAEASVVTEEVHGTATLWGNSISFTTVTSLSLASPILGKLIDLLRVNMEDTRDTIIQTVLSKGTNVIYGHTATGTVATSNAAMNGTYSLTQKTLDLAVATLQDGGANYFSDTSNNLTIATSNGTPRPAGSGKQFYIGIVSNRQAKDITKIAGYVNNWAYNNPEVFYFNEVGIVGEVRFIQTNSLFNVRRQGFVGTTAATPGITVKASNIGGGTWSGVYQKVIVTGVDPYGHESRIWSTSTGLSHKLVAATNSLCVTLPAVTGTGTSRTAIIGYRIYTSIGMATSASALAATAYLIKSATVDGVASVNTAKFIAASATAAKKVNIVTPATTYAAEIMPAPAATGYDSAIWYSYILGNGAYAVMEDGPVETNYLGEADKSDRYGLLKIMTWKAIFGAFYLDNNFIVQVRTNSNVATTSVTI